MQNFEDYLCERNDTIDNAAYQLIGVLTAEDPGASLEDDPATPNWDMAIIKSSHWGMDNSNFLGGADLAVRATMSS